MPVSGYLRIKGKRVGVEIFPVLFTCFRDPLPSIKISKGKGNLVN